MTQQHIDKSWTLFLDRDGVINKKAAEHCYITKVEDFVFIPGVLPALRLLRKYYGKIIIVTNQQGIQKGQFGEKDLSGIHAYMLTQIAISGGIIHRVYHCPDVEDGRSFYRKPAPGMALMAQKDFPDIDFLKSTMVGDSESDRLFAANVGMEFSMVDNHYDLLAFAYDTENGNLCPR